MDVAIARQLFHQHISQPDDQIDLGHAALLIAQEEYPALAVEEYLNALDTMAAKVAERLPSERYPMRLIQTVNRYLYEDLGFVGNERNYYDPRNSFLNDVLDRRTGIPISLSLVYLELVKRLDFPMAGVGMPGHFLIRPIVEDMEIFIDPFHRGEVMFAEDCKTRLQDLYGASAQFRPEFLDTISPRRFLARMLTNLKVIYLNQGEWLKCLAAIERILLLFPDVPNELRDRGLIYYQLHRWAEAHRDLTTYLAAVPIADDTATIRQVVQQLEQDLG